MGRINVDRAKRDAIRIKLSHVAEISLVLAEEKNLNFTRLRVKVKRSRREK